MKKVILLAITALFIVGSYSSTAQTHAMSKTLRHVVLFKFKDGTSQADIQKIVDAFGKLPKKIPTIKDFEWGANNSPEKLNDGLTHCFFVTFASETDRNNYLVDPAHKAFVEVLKPHLDKAVVVDYWANK